MEVDKVTDRVADMVAENKKNVISIKLEIQFGERVGHGGWLIWTQTFLTWSFPTGLRIF